MRILIAEDDYASRTFLSKFLSAYGTCDLTIDGIEALDAFLLSFENGKPYDLICLDIMMPKVDGLKVLKTIREIEKRKKVSLTQKVKIVMTTALSDTASTSGAFNTGCEAYVTKPIDTQKLVDIMKGFHLIA